MYICASGSPVHDGTGGMLEPNTQMALDNRPVQHTQLVGVEQDDCARTHGTRMCAHLSGSPAAAPPSRPVPPETRS